MNEFNAKLVWLTVLISFWFRHHFADWQKNIVEFCGLAYPTLCVAAVLLMLLTDWHIALEKPSLEKYERCKRLVDYKTSPISQLINTSICIGFIATFAAIGGWWWLAAMITIVSFPMLVLTNRIAVDDARNYVKNNREPTP